MENENKEWVRNEWREVLSYLFIPGLIMLIVVFVGFALKGFEESFIQGEAIRFGSYIATATIYLFLLVPAILCVIFPLAKAYSIGKNDPVTTPKPSWFRILTISFLFATEENSLLYYASEQSGFKGKKNLFRWMKNPLKLIMFSIFLFVTFGFLLMINPQLAVAGVPPASVQQITGASEVTFGSLLPAFAENGTILFLFMLMMGGVAWLCAKFFAKTEYARWIFYSLGFLVVIIGGFLWASLHMLVYSNSGIAYINTVIFGMVGLALTLLTGSFIPFFIWHICNNLFLILSKTVTIKSDVLFITGGILFIMLVVFIGRTIYKINHKVKESQFTIPEN